MAALISSAKADDTFISITLKPQPVYIEQGATAQYLNFDFVVENLTSEKLLIHSIEVSVFDQNGELELRRFIDDNGTSQASKLSTIERLKARKPF